MKNNKDNLWKLRHTAEHVLQQAVKELYPDILLAMGPATAEGFYFDFDGKVEGKSEVILSEADFARIEKRMKKIIQMNLPISGHEIGEKEARELFKDNPYKQEWIDEAVKKGEKITVYWTGKQGDKHTMVDLCKGPHVISTGKVKAFKLLSVAGAYWRGDEKNKMLTRIYGTAFETKGELEKYLWQLKEAKKRDHRKIGKELELFTISEKVGPGLVLWLPKGNIIREELMAWAHKTEKIWGYKHVATPHITKANLYYTSGHLPYYKNDMFPPMKLDEDKEKYYLKPMNCPHHHMVYQATPKSYRDLPLRYAEHGMCYRYEASGELFGLMRVRGLEINDAHIYCSQEQAVEEFVNVMKLHEYYYKSLGIKKYHLEIALRDPKDTKKYHGDSKMWEKAESLMREAVKQVDIPMVEEEGSAAFYGPKIDFIIHSSIGREFAVSTNQIDLYMGGRFKLEYTDQDGKQKTPVIIHRAPLGSNERFIGFLIEHYAGAFPLWLAPVQVSIIPISDKHLGHAKSAVVRLLEKSIRVELDDSSQRMQAKIRTATLQKTPYIGIIGDKEVKTGSIAIRTRNGKDLGQQPLDRFIQKLTTEIEKKI